MADRIEVGLALVSWQGHWLVGRRAPGRIFAGLWEFPGGKVQRGETPSEAAVREVREETGLGVEAAGSLGEIETSQEGGAVVLHLVRCAVVGSGSSPPEVRPADAGVACLRWVTADELVSLPMPPANAEIVARLTSADGTQGFG